MGWELKALRSRNLGNAVALAQRYRDLNQPEDAESICRDVLAVDPENQEALRTLGLALTDQFPTSWMTLFDDAFAVFAKLRSEYEQMYYAGIAWERYARAQQAFGRAHNAVHAFEEAIARFEVADRLASADDPAPILHYNRCVRALTTDPELTRASTMPPDQECMLGD